MGDLLESNDYYKLVYSIFETPKGRELIKELKDEYIYSFSPLTCDSETEMWIRIGKQEIVKDFVDIIKHMKQHPEDRS